MPSDIQIFITYAAAVLISGLAIFVVVTCARILYADWKADRDYKRLREKLETTQIIRKDKSDN